MNPIRISSDLVLLKIDASRCSLRVGDWVTPDTIIGEDSSQAEVRAGYYGQVESINFSAEDHALFVIIREGRPSAVGGEEEQTEPVVLKIEASRCGVRIGDRVSPETVVGEDYETGETVTAEVEGRVKAVHFIPRDHAFAVEIQPSA